MIDLKQAATNKMKDAEKEEKKQKVEEEANRKKDGKVT